MTYFVKGYGKTWWVCASASSICVCRSQRSAKRIASALNAAVRAVAEEEA